MVARATVEIQATLRDGVSKPVLGIRAAVNSVFTGLRGLVAGGLAASFVVAVKNIGLATAEMGRFAETIGESVEDVSRLKFALATIGKGDDLKGLLNQLTGKTADAIRGPGQTRSAFAQLGVDLRELQSLGAIDILRQLADGYSLAGNRAQAGAQLQAIFGDQFRELLPLLSQGSKGFDELARASDRLGGTIRAEDALNAKEFARNWAEFETLTQSVFRDLANKLLPQINKALQAIKDLLGDDATPNVLRAQASRLASQPSGATFGRDPAVEAVLKRFGAIVENLGPDPSYVAAGVPAPDRLTIANKSQVLEAIGKEIEAEEKLGEVRKRNAEAISSDSFFEGFRAEITSTNTELGKMFEAGKRGALELQSILGNNVSGVLRGIRQGVLSTKDALDALLDGVLEDLAEYATSELVKRLISAGFDFAFGGGGGGTDPDIGPPTASGAGGGSLLGGDGLKRLGRGGGGGGTTINLQSNMSMEQQRELMSVIVQHEVSRNRRVKMLVREA